MKDIEHTRKLILDADTKLTEAEKRKKGKEDHYSRLVSSL